MITADREQMYLMPPSVQEWLPDGDLAWMVLEDVEQMDMSGFSAAPSAEGGRPSYDPGIMVALLL